MVATKSADGRSARERLLAAANELFYEEGIHAVGIDRVIERAGVAKASLYTTFGSKEALVEAYLEARSAARSKRVLDAIAKHDAPREKLLAIFDSQIEATKKPGYRGCAFVNAWAEEPVSGAPKVQNACLAARSWMRELMASLARELGVADPDCLARRLHVLYDALAVSASFRQDAEAAGEARAMAEMVIDAAASKKRAKR